MACLWAFADEQERILSGNNAIYSAKMQPALERALGQGELLKAYAVSAHDPAIVSVGFGWLAQAEDN